VILTEGRPRAHSQSVERSDAGPKAARLSGVVVLATTAFAQLRANSVHLFQASPLTITDPTMSVIGTMVGRRGASFGVPVPGSEAHNDSTSRRAWWHCVGFRRSCCAADFRITNPYERCTP
jgi:hypothetical protein